MCHDPPSFADGRTYTDSSWSVRQVGVQKIDEKEATFRYSSIAGYWVYGGNPIFVKYKLFEIPKRFLVYVDIYR